MSLEEDLPRSWVSRLLLLLTVSGWLGVASIPATAQGQGDAIDLVLIADRSGRAPDPGLRGAMGDLLTLWGATAAPQDRLFLLRGGPFPRMMGEVFSMRDAEDRVAFQRMLTRLGGFDRGDARWLSIAQLAVRSLSGLPDPAPSSGLLALARADPADPEALSSAAAALAGPPARPFFALSLEQSLGRLDATLAKASGGVAAMAPLDEGRYPAALRLWGALSPYRWTTWLVLPPGLEQRLELPPGTIWAAFVLVRPSPSVRLVNLIHEGTDWLGPAAQARIDRVSTDRLEIVTLLTFGSYEGEWRIRSEGEREAGLGVVVSVRSPLLPQGPAPARRWTVPAGAPLFLEAIVPRWPPDAILEWQAGDLRIPLRDDGGEADREAGDGRASGLFDPGTLSGRVEGAFRLSWKGGIWEQPAWLDLEPDLPILKARVPVSPTPGMPITITVDRPDGVETVSWRWAGWRLGSARYQPPEAAIATESGWQWTFRTPTGGKVRFLALGEVRISTARVYPQAVVVDLAVVAPTEGRLFVTLEKRPQRLTLPGELTLVITSTLDRPAQLRLEIVEGKDRVQVIPALVPVPAREVIRRKIQVRGEGLPDPQSVRIRLREEKGAPVEGGELSFLVAPAKGGGFSPVWLCLSAAVGAGGFLLLRRLMQRSRERWP